MKSNDRGVIVSYLVIAFLCNNLLFGGKLKNVKQFGAIHCKDDQAYNTLKNDVCRSSS